MKKKTLINEVRQFKKIAGLLKEDYNKPSEEHVRNYWSTMVEHQPEDVINTLVNLTTGQTSIESFTRSTMDDVFDSYRDDL